MLPFICTKHIKLFFRLLTLRGLFLLIFISSFTPIYAQEVPDLPEFLPELQILPVFPEPTPDKEEIEELSQPQPADEETTPPYPNYQFLVETEGLFEHLDDPDIRTIDMRSSMKSYLEGHIPGALYMDINTLRTESKGVRGRVPSKRVVENILGGYGIDNSTIVVIYDDEGGLNASHLFWVLDYVGHRDMALLNGGIDKWIEEGFPLEEEVLRVKAKTFRAKVNRKRRVNVKWILKNLENPRVAFIDTRSKLEYLGLYKLSKRSGHIPGAVSIEWKKNLVEGPFGLFKSREELRSLYEGELVTDDKIVVTYGQSFYRGSLTYFVLRLLDYNVKGYQGSWEEWGNREDLPVEK